jgi:ABC-2 type transport system permease protein
LLTKILAFAYRNWIFAKRNFFAFTEIVFWPFVSLVGIGLMSNFLDLKGDVTNFILTGAIAGGVLQVTQLDVSYGLLYDIWSKSIKHTFLAPVRPYHYVLGSWCIGMIRGSVVFILLLIFSYLAFGFTLPSVMMTLIFVSGIYLNALVIGMMVCFLVLLYGQRVEVTAWSLATLAMLVSGIYYPVTYLPAFVRVISQFIPLTFFLEHLRSGYGFTPIFSYPLLKGYALLAAYILIFLWLLQYAFGRARRTGMILRLSE